MRVDETGFAAVGPVIGVHGTDTQFQDLRIGLSMMFFPDLQSEFGWQEWEEGE